jgi:hypothetical protein
LSEFIGIQTGKLKLDVLIIEGTATDQQLQAAYDGILNDFYELLQLKETKTYVEIQKRLVKATIKIDFVIAIFNVWLIVPSKELKEILSNNDFQFDEGTEQEEILKRFDAYIKYQNILIEKEQKVLDNWVEKNKSTSKPSDEVFILNLITLGKHYGFNVEEEKTKVNKYALMMRELENYVNMQNDINNAK